MSEYPSPATPDSTKTCCASGEQGCWMNYFGWQIPLAILLATLLVTNGLEFSNLFAQHQRLAGGQKQLAQADVQKQFNQAIVVSQKLDQLARGIVALAPNDAAAKKIQDDFRISVRK